MFECSKVGTLNKHTIYKLDQVDIIPYYRSTAALTDEQKQYNDKYLSMIHQTFNTPNFYFSYTYDLR